MLANGLRCGIGFASKLVPTDWIEGASCRQQRRHRAIQDIRHRAHQLRFASGDAPVVLDAARQRLEQLRLLQRAQMFQLLQCGLQLAQAGGAGSGRGAKGRPLQASANACSVCRSLVSPTRARKASSVAQASDRSASATLPILPLPGRRLRSMMRSSVHSSSLTLPSSLISSAMFSRRARKALASSCLSAGMARSSRGRRWPGSSRSSGSSSRSSCSARLRFRRCLIASSWRARRPGSLSSSRP